MRPLRHPPRLGQPLLLLLGLAACAEPGGPVVIEVFAASSMTDALPKVSAAFERAHPGVRVRHSFAGSQVLRLQIEEGADADVFVSADPAHLRALRESGHLERIDELAEVELVLALAPGAPPLEGLQDLPRVERLVLGTAGVPVGRYARALLDAATPRFGDAWREAVDARVVSEESNVRLVRAKLLLGEADAAFLYASDLDPGEGLRRVPLPPGLAPAARLAAGRVRGDDARATEHATAYLAFLRSPAARSSLAAEGFTLARETPAAPR